MDDGLLTYYERELAYLRRAAGAFAEANPKVAGRLRLSADQVQDPMVGHLIESVAFLNARVRKKLDDSFPELTDAILGAFFPHYTAPIPSMSILQMVPVSELTGPYLVPRGEAVETEPVEGEHCRFRTAYPVTLWPIEVREAAYVPGVVGAVQPPRTAGAQAMVRLKLASRAPETSLDALAPPSLVFYLRGAASEVHPLYRLLFSALAEAAVVDAATGAVRWLGSDAVRPYGFEPEQSLLPRAEGARPGYLLLSELFVFPEKYLFVEVTGLADALAGFGKEAELILFFRDRAPELESSVTAETFCLGCTPIVNLFSQKAEPIRLSHRTPEYRVVPDVRRVGSREVYSVERVVASSPDGDEVAYRPFYGRNHRVGPGRANAFWHAVRHGSERGDADDLEPDHGTEVYLSLTDLDFAAAVPDDWVLEVETTCLNRDLPGRLPFGGGHPRMQVGDGTAPLERVTCLTAPTPTRRPALGEALRWRLVAQLNLNHLPLLSPENGAELIKELLALYNFDDSAATRSLIDGVLDFKARPATAVVSVEGGSATLRGVEVWLTLDEHRFDQDGMFLFASVLERFLALYASINLFTRLVLTTNQRDTPLKVWAPRAGSGVVA